MSIRVLLAVILITGAARADNPVGAGKVFAGPEGLTVTIVPRSPAVQPTQMEERLVVLRHGDTLESVLKTAGIGENAIASIVAAFTPTRGEPVVPEGRRLSLLMADLDGSGTNMSLARLSVYNDETLEALMRGFVECRIKPYYLHHGDLAPGTAHLRTTLAHGQELMRALRGRVSGLCQPDYVLDIPGGHGKAPVGPSYLSSANSFSRKREQAAETRYRVTDYCGEVHLYPPEP